MEVLDATITEEAFAVLGYRHGILHTALTVERPL